MDHTVFQVITGIAGVAIGLVLKDVYRRLTSLETDGKGYMSAFSKLEVAMATLTGEIRRLADKLEQRKDQ